MKTLGVWVPFRAGGELGVPEQLPLGRAALKLEAQGIAVVLGCPTPRGFDGVRASPRRWFAVQSMPVDAVYDRFPSQSRPEEFARGLRDLGDVLVVNPPAITALCRDKLVCQQALEAHGVLMPDVVGDVRRFEQALKDWGTAFLKPREGSFGKDVSLVHSGARLPLSGDWVLQRAVPPPRDWAGLSVRVLCQRTASGRVLLRPGVARQSRTDPVVNAARGADLAPADDVLSSATSRAVRELCVQTMAALADQPMGDRMVEAGLDAVIDEQGRPWLIEVNSRPRGRLRELARKWPARFQAAHVLACVTPLRSASSWVSK